MGRFQLAELAFAFEEKAIGVFVQAREIGRHLLQQDADLLLNLEKGLLVGLFGGIPPPHQQLFQIVRPLPHLQSGRAVGPRAAAR